ncbi:MAG: hypothetical protein NWE93_06825 [Candidatus Bathyarchaeota archaeon]|nr:hypothetical protein [Candidatus Bathyarchaeota archaeon]
MQKTLETLPQRLQQLHLVEKLLIQGLILAVTLTIVQMYLESQEGPFMAYLPPIGFALWLTVAFLVQPIAVGALNIFLINLLYGTKGWQVGFWLNGVFLVLLFMALNTVLQTALGWPFIYVAALDIAVLSLPLGCMARFSNGGWKKPIN